jgi:hypothetical protein
MDWFESITGFREDGYDATRSRLSIVEGRLLSSRSDRTWSIGQFDIPSLAELRLRVAGLTSGQGPTRVSCVQGDVRRMHRDRDNAGALFQVASQFNLLEMVSPAVTPEHGVTRYQSDATQGPACAIAAGAGTIYRNYLVPLDGHLGQRADRQIDCLRGIGDHLGNADGSLWLMRNGYCMTTEEGLARIDAKLRQSDPSQLDELKRQLRIGLHCDVEVTDEDAGHMVSQAYCSALPVAYNQIRHQSNWESFACLVLDAAYEATLLSAVLNRQVFGNPVVFLTRLGGGAFGNDAHWIAAAMRRALATCRDAALDIRIVSYSNPGQDVLDLVRDFSTGHG